ncbi:bpX6 domain-containing protein [Kitasatospora camelliae]|uniref:BpX6 domain-containing protein n=1 Tax=Kitasatospora camelliae TaxID=3156397 RepID=A0AAU8K3Q0_9ACTN
MTGIPAPRTTAVGAFRGTVRAAALVLDTPAIGPAEAAGRVLAHWRAGAELRLLPDGRWLLRLAAPVDLRADRAPGLPLAERAGALRSAGVAETGLPGEVVLLHGGATRRYRLADLPALHPEEWLDAAGLEIRPLTPLGRPFDPEPPVEDVPERPGPDLRAAAGVAPQPAGAVPGDGGGRSARYREWFGILGLLALAAFLTMAQEEGSRFLGHQLLVAVLSMLVLAALIAVLPGTPAGTGTSPNRRAASGGRQVGQAVAALATAAARMGGRLVRALAGPRLPTRRTPAPASTPSVPAGSRPPGLLRRLLGRGGRATGRQAPRVRDRWAELRTRFSALALRSPAGPVLGGRHARYLRRLTEAFEQRRWEDALRDAVGMASGAGTPGWLSLGVPQRRLGPLDPSPFASSGGPMVAYGPDVQSHLRALYRRAAEELERAGRVAEAAFVLADLLGLPSEAVALLARAGRHRQAAELAEGRELDPELAVRLWWQAGERDRAVRLARTRKAFAHAVERLRETDPAAARELRTAWVLDCREAGDRFAAVEAAWPDEELRPMVAADLRDAVALGGAPRARALPRLAALGAGAAVRPLTLALLTGRGPELAAERGRLAATLAEFPGADQALDRELATAAARAVVRDRGFGPSASWDGADRRLFADLLRRADPLTAADLRPPRRGPQPSGPLVATAHDEPGRLPATDAALLESGAVLVALGQAGVRLLGPDGRVKARWGTPCDRLVPADHGSVALLVARYGASCEVARLDLATRKVRRWATIRADWLAGSFDGRTLITADGDGIAVLDTTAERPTVVWRELGAESRLAGPIARTATSCSAVVATGRLLELWRWDLPGWELRSRHPLDPARDQVHGLTAHGAAVTLTGTPADGYRVRWHGSHGENDRTLPGGPAPLLLTDAEWHGLALPQPDASVRLDLGTNGSASPVARLLLPATTPDAIRLRGHGPTTTVLLPDGRIIATTPDTPTPAANLRLTPS